LLQVQEKDGFLQEALRFEKDYKHGRMLLLSKVIISASLYFPVVLLSFSDTGVFFGLVSNAYSALLGLKRGVGSVGTWDKLVQSFPQLLVQYAQHCVSDQAWDELGGHEEGRRKEVSDIESRRRALALRKHEKDGVLVHVVLCPLPLGKEVGM
jgi:hypothetical protein